MKLEEILKQPECYEKVWVDADGNILNEAAVRMFKRIGKEIHRRYRCTTGPKKGKPVSDPKMCATRKDPRKVRHGRKVARTKKGVRIRKSSIAKRTSMSRMVRRMNQRISGNLSAGTKKSDNTKSSSTKKPAKTTKSPSTKKPAKTS
jgi:hypothetical protein